MTSTRYTELRLSELFDRPSSPVRAKVFICATGRTGSSLLCRAMFHHGIGLPHEYFNAGHIALIGQRSGIHALADGSRLGSDSEARRAYITALMDRRTANGIFAAKIHWGQYASYLDNPEGVELFQQAHFVQLYREDLLAQAISFHVAKETGRWGSDDTVSTPPASVPRFFDVDLIADYMKTLAESDSSWRLFFARNAISPLTVSYERVRDDVAGVLRTIVDSFGLDLPTNCFDYAEEAPTEVRDAQVPPRSEIKARFLRAHQRVIPALRGDALQTAGDMNAIEVAAPPPAPPAGTGPSSVIPTDDEPRVIGLNVAKIEVGYPAGPQSEDSPTQPCTEARAAAVETGRPMPDQGQATVAGRRVAGMKTIGLCMIVKNEAKLIGQCLVSALPLVDYVLVVDTGSEDGTQQIIRDFLAEHAVPGMVIEEPWRDFAYNRTFALERLREIEGIDYAMIIDADDVVVLDAGFDPRAFKTQMEHDLYDVQILHGGMSYSRAQICNNRLPFSFKGVVHEYLEVPTGTSSRATAEGFSIRASTDGARSQNPRKYQDDAALLERALATGTDPFLISRYTFYLAQSQKDCGEREKALDNYLKRAELGFWNEEIYISLLEAGNLMAALDRPFDEVIATYERAAQTVPARAEALHAASVYCRQQGRNAEGQEYARRGIELTPPVGGLFVQRWVYDYGILDEFAINAYWAGAYRESLDASLKLLASGKLPPSLVQHVADNARLAADKLPEAKAPDLGTLGAESMVRQHTLVPQRSLRSRVTGPPRVLVAILAQQKEPALPLYLECIEALDYPKSSIVLYIRTNNNTDRTEPILREWVARVGHLYAAVDFDTSDVADRVGQYREHEWDATRFKVLGHIRSASLRRALELGCDFYFVADVDNFIRPATLRELVALDLPIAAPLLRSIIPERFYSNYHAEIDAAGYYKNCDQYYWILNRHVRGIVEVPVVNCTYLVRADMIPELTYEEESGRYDYVIFSDSALKAGIPQYIDNRQVYGYITFGEGEQHLGAGIKRARALLRGAGDRAGYGSAAAISALSGDLGSTSGAGSGLAEPAPRTISVLAPRPPGYVHSGAFTELAETLFYGFQQLGYDARLVSQLSEAAGRVVVVSAHLLSGSDAIQLPAGTIIYNAEVVQQVQRFPHYADLLRKHEIWDYGHENAKHVAAFLSKSVQYVPVGFVPQLARIDKSNVEDIDVLFYGTLNPRRETMLRRLEVAGLRAKHLSAVYGAERDALIARAKVVLNMHYHEPGVFEIVRVAYLLTNAKAVVCECNPGETVDADLSSGIFTAKYDDLIEACRLLVADSARRRALEQAGFDAFRSRCEADILVKALATTWSPAGSSDNLFIDADAG